MKNEDDCSGLVLGLFIASIFCLCPFSISGKADYESFVRHAYVVDISPLVDSTLKLNSQKAPLMRYKMAVTFLSNSQIRI